MIRAILLCLLAAPLVGAQTRELDLQSTSGWADTGIDLKKGDGIRVNATGQLQYPDARQTNGPDGLPRAFTDLIRNFPLNQAGRGALIGRIGTNEAARPFLIGKQYSGQAWIAGHLFIAINQTASDQPGGSYHVIVEKKEGIRPAAPPQDEKVPSFPQRMIDSIPRRVSDPNGAPGDRVNFIIVGSQEQLQAAFKAAGWVPVDRTQKEAVIRGLLASFSKEAYVTMPMSELHLFDRAQDFGYAQADPLRVVAARHHFRIWKAPFDLEGQEVWVGAGTHDIGFDRDQRNNGVTHKIDPNTDGERDYIRDGLTQTGLVVKTDYLTPTDPVLTAKTATGEEFNSDGRTLLVYLTANNSNFSTGFADIFCSVLKQKNPDGGEWGPCSRYIDATGKEDLPLAPLSTANRVLIVPGILSSCVADSPAFREGQDALKRSYGLDVALLQVPNDSSESNARMIGDYVRDH